MRTRTIWYWTLFAFVAGSLLGNVALGLWLGLGVAFVGLVASIWMIEVAIHRDLRRGR